MICTRKYKKRILDEVLKRKLKGIGAILIEEPKWCGKTTTGERLANIVLYKANPEEKQNILLADLNPNLLLEDETPRFIDEWQIAPKLWDAVRFEVDHRDKEGHFILTGSVVPANSSKNNSY